MKPVLRRTKNLSLLFCEIRLYPRIILRKNVAICQAFLRVDFGLGYFPHDYQLSRYFTVFFARYPATTVLQGMFCAVSGHHIIFCKDLAAKGLYGMFVQEPATAQFQGAYVQDPVTTVLDGGTITSRRGTFAVFLFGNQPTAYTVVLLHFFFALARASLK